MVKESNMEQLTNSFSKTSFNLQGLSFQGRSLKLDTAEDAKEIIDAIENCSKLEYLNLEGNTLGVEAAKAIAKSLEKHPELQQALWKDLFTGRKKSEIPVALKYLGDALVKAGVKLKVLDLSDNAFGPIGVQGLAALLKSSVCFELEELRLNNNGLGISGGRMLAEALTDCYKESKKSGNPLALRIFIAGRNRLENDGATELAKVFELIGSLEEISMPQNGIYFPGITALSEAFTKNINLQKLNLNDNTFTRKGSRAMAKALPNLQNLREINFGDCLIKTKGAIDLAHALNDKHNNLENLTLDSNEIKVDGALALANAMKNKTKLKKITLSSNSFGKNGVEKIKTCMQNVGKFNELGEFSEDDNSEDEDDYSTENSDNDVMNSSDEEDIHNTKNNEKDDSQRIGCIDLSGLNLDVSHSEGDLEKLEEFLHYPTLENFVALGNKANKLLADKIQGFQYEDEEEFINKHMKIIMKVSSLNTPSTTTNSETIVDCCNILYQDVISWANNHNCIYLFTNSLLVHLGLLKGEDKSFKATWDIDGCFRTLSEVINKNYFPSTVQETLKSFLQMNDKFMHLDSRKKLQRNLK